MKQPERIACSRCRMTFRNGSPKGMRGGERSRCPQCLRPFSHAARHQSGSITTWIEERDLGRWGYRLIGVLDDGISE